MSEKDFITTVIIGAASGLIISITWFITLPVYMGIILSILPILYGSHMWERNDRNKGNGKNAIFHPDYTRGAALIIFGFICIILLIALSILAWIFNPIYRFIFS